MSRGFSSVTGRGSVWWQQAEPQHLRTPSHQALRGLPLIYCCLRGCLCLSLAAHTFMSSAEVKARCGSVGPSSDATRLSEGCAQPAGFFWEPCRERHVPEEFRGSKAEPPRAHNCYCLKALPALWPHSGISHTQWTSICFTAVDTIQLV